MHMKKFICFFLLFCILLPSAQAETQFSDAKEGDWFFENIYSMTEMGYIKGYPDKTFRPGKNITAAEFVSVAARVKGLSPSHSQVGHWAGGLLQAALELGWYDWDEIPPDAARYDQPITRQLAVKIVMKAFMPDKRGDYVTESAKMADFALLDGRYYEAVLAAYAAGVVQGDEKGCFSPKATLTRAEACAMLMRAQRAADGLKNDVCKEDKTIVAVRGGVSTNGQLRVEGRALLNKNGEVVVLRGMSSHGVQWFPQFLSKKAIESTAANGANLFRIAMYTAENGYIADKSMKNAVFAAVDAAIALDMYVIIDWHILSDGNPKTYENEAKEFFREAAERYSGEQGVLYEICNEPNGAVTWEDDVKPYAEDIIDVIRAESPEAVILVGSPNWSQDLHEAAKMPIDRENIMYTCHFYAGTHQGWLRDRITDCKLPVFVSEWGMSRADGSGGVFKEEAEKWLEFMAQNNISWANWSYCDKNETSAAVRVGADPSDGISYDELTESGRFVFECFGK